MGIKLCKKESMERCDSCGAIMTEYEYDRYGGICKYCRSKESKQEDADGFSHTWELQAQQAKETLEEITKKFGDADRLKFSTHNYPHRHECDAYVTVDGNPFITAEFEGGRHGGIRWHCYEDDVSDMRLDAGDEDAAKNMILAFKTDILDALESLYGFGAIADEGDQHTEGKVLAKEKRIYPKFVQINTQEDFDKYIKPALGKGVDAYGLSDIKGMWWEIADGEEVPPAAKTVREIRDSISKSPHFIFISGAGVERGITDMPLAGYAREMGMAAKGYLDGYNPGSSESTKSEATLNALWCVEFGDIYNNIKKEYWGTEAEAKARYDELAERGDIEWVEKPTIETVSKAEELSYDDYAESVKAVLMGREFEYGPETANEFVVDDYKDIVRKNFDAGKNAFSAAADIDDTYMKKE